MGQKLKDAANRTRQMWVAAAMAIVFSVVLMKFAVPFANLRYDNDVLSYVGRVRAALISETQEVAIQVKEIAAENDFSKYISDKDILSLISVLDSEKKKRGIEFALATDRNGTVLTRLQNTSIRGDNYFQTTAVGRVLAGKQEVAVVERSRLLPLAIFAGQPIKTNGEMIGAFAVARALDDDYAVRFKAKYLKGEAEIFFYDARGEAVGGSVADPSSKQLLSLFLNEGIRDGVEGAVNAPQKHVEFNNRYWIAKNISFPGLEESPGGALIVFNVNHKKLALIFTGIAVIFFLLLEIILCRIIFPAKTRASGKHYFVLAAWTIMVFAVIFGATDYVLNKNSLRVQMPPYTIYNSTLALEPEADVMNRDYDSRIAIILRSGGESINAVEASLSYDPMTVRISDIITANSFCDPGMFLEKTIDNRNGKVVVACGLPNPGFNQPQGTVAEIVLRPLKDGYFYLRFNGDTKVLANDGLGTNVLRVARDGGYRAAGSSSDSEEEFFTVFSYTHPNSEKWYKRKNIYFSWVPMEDFEYRYAFNRDVEYVLGKDDPVTNATRLSFNAEEDGVYYLRLALEKDGKPAKEIVYKVMIDATPPQIFAVRSSSNEAEPGDVVRFDFSTRDELSGLQNAYYVQIDGGIFLPVQPPLYAPFAEAGEHTVAVRAFDKAGNVRDAAAKITVK